MAQVSESGAFAQLSDAREKHLGKPESSSKLLESLDSLLEQYLQLLHRHQTLHAQLGNQLSSGFFSLAQANYSSPGRRYGQDYYDERMKATRRISVKPPANREDKSLEPEETEDTGSSSQSYMFKIKTTLADYETEEEKPKSETAISGENAESSESALNPGSGETAEDRTETPSTPGESEEGAPSKNSSSSTAPKRALPSPDPLRWYGVLVPPSLRSAQRSFVTATESMSELASIATEIRNVEERVFKLRCRLGLS
ncbi:hypothetical protein DTO063F5_1258 [Paecilomyces variotii]|nr:hypothetical protein DTO063F5_1258 [Paecilomyces variotii]